MILVTPTRLSSAKSCPAASKPSEIEVLPSADIWSIPALITAALYDHDTRVVASFAKDTTEKRAASSLFQPALWDRHLTDTTHYVTCMTRKGVQYSGH